MTRRIRSSTVLLAVVAAWPALAADIASSGSWSVPVDATDLQAGAGTDLVTERSSAAGEVVLDLTNLSSAADAWRVDVARADGSWDDDVHLFVSRTSTGTGPGSISGGTGWVEVTAAASAFFSGTGDRSGVGVRLKVTGLSVGSLPPSLCASQLTYTVVDIP